jgi:Cu/Ag efflux protein CusF
MKNHPNLAAIALALALGSVAITAPQSAMAASQASETVGGVVTKIDLDAHRVTVRNGDDTTYEFEASDETLKDLKVGDSIEAKRRPTTK